MTSVNENNLFPPVPPSEEQLTNELQLIHPDLIEEIEENNLMVPEPDIPSSVPEPDNPSSVPEPETPDEREIIPGQFDYIKEDWYRKLLVNAWQAINITENWDFVKQPIDSFIWSNDPRVRIIGNKMEELGYDGHSGSSFGCTMRTMQYIANHGEKKFKEDILSSNQ